MGYGVTVRGYQVNRSCLGVKRCSERSRARKGGREGKERVLGERKGGKGEGLGWRRRKVERVRKPLLC